MDLKYKRRDKKMKSKHLIYLTICVSAIVALCFVSSAGTRVNAFFHRSIITMDESGQVSQADTGKIVFYIPRIKCGNVSWNDTEVLNWLSKNCMDKCDDPTSSGYRFSGKIVHSHKSWSMKVTIKTDKEYMQPVMFNSEKGTFEGKLYFDKTNRGETPITIYLRDSSRVTINTFVITLTE
jgi:hypothetical protein